MKRLVVFAIVSSTFSIQAFAVEPTVDAQNAIVAIDSVLISPKSKINASDAKTLQWAKERISYVLKALSGGEIALQKVNAYEKCMEAVQKNNSSLSGFPDAAYECRNFKY